MRYVRDYGLRLLPELYALDSPMTHGQARDLEVELAIDLRESGCRVWQAWRTRWMLHGDIFASNEIAVWYGGAQDHGEPNWCEMRL